jgi:RNase P subunit RPR2
MTTSGRSETLATVSCAECGRSPRAGETWRILFADKVAREAVIYCRECAERERFGGSAPIDARGTSY